MDRNTDQPIDFQPESGILPKQYIDLVPMNWNILYYDHEYLYILFRPFYTFILPFASIITKMDPQPFNALCPEQHKYHVLDISKKSASLWIHLYIFSDKHWICKFSIYRPGPGEKCDRKLGNVRCDMR